MPAVDQPAAEVQIDDGLVRRLVREQHPDLADLELVPLAFGWDNVIFRLGSDLVVRLPRRQMAVALVEHEQRWLPELAHRLPVPIPAPVRIGRAGAGYPWPWSVCPWLPGVMAATASRTDGLGAGLAGFVAALHQPAPADAPANPYRGVPLREREGPLRDRVDQLDDVLDGAAVLRLWEAAVEVPDWDGPPLWLHGDLHPANLLVDGSGGLAAVIDFGDITSGDPASDLAVAWMLPPREGEAFRAGLAHVDEHTWSRARGWALDLGIACLSASADNPVMAAIGRSAVASALSSASSSRATP